ncbi:MAG: hypothetical protein K8R89_06575 [Anaerolineae bacterium]|nr:hypothetical protein [Anaerolineae bacterium]
MNLEQLIRKIGDSSKRSTWQVIGFFILIPMLLGWFLWNSFMGKPAVLLTPEEALLETILLDTVDLPARWSLEDIDIEQVNVPQGIGKIIWFRQFFDRPWINIREEVYVYQSEEATQQGYENQLSEYARFELQGWNAVPAFSFSPRADEIHASCTEGYINGQHHFPCAVVGQYGRVVMVVGGNIFDKRWLRADQFRQVLITADQKANLSRHKQ